VPDDYSRGTPPKPIVTGNLVYWSVVYAASFSALHSKSAMSQYSHQTNELNAQVVIARAFMPQNWDVKQCPQRISLTSTPEASSLSQLQDFKTAMFFTD